MVPRKRPAAGRPGSEDRMRYGIGVMLRPVPAELFSRARTPQRSPALPRSPARDGAAAADTPPAERAAQPDAVAGEESVQQIEHGPQDRPAGRGQHPTQP